MSEVVTPPKPRLRKNAGERRDEIVETASALAVSDGLEAVTAKRLAAELGVYPGLITHYFGSIDDLLAAAFALAVERERDEVYSSLAGHESFADRLVAIVDSYTSPARDATSLLWLDGWQAGRRRPAFRATVADQMDRDVDALSALVEAGNDAGELHVADPRGTAMSILALVDGLSVQAAVRERLDYATVVDDFTRAALALLGLGGGAA